MTPPGIVERGLEELDAEVVIVDPAGRDAFNAALHAELQQYKAIMRSMTPEEKQDPSMVNKSRADRIADGAGVERGDVRQMIKQCQQAKNMMEKVQVGGQRGGMKDMLRQLGM